jgi:hypothetical protein
MVKTIDVLTYPAQARLDAPFTAQGRIPFPILEWLGLSPLRASSEHNLIARVA